MDGDQASPILLDVVALTKRYREQFALAFELIQWR
jgi:hypothetical protein